MKQQSRPLSLCRLGEKYACPWTLCLVDQKYEEPGMSMWTMFLEIWRTPTTKCESERKQSKNDRKTITTSECQANPLRRTIGYGYTNHVLGRPSQGNSTNHGLVHTESSKEYQIRCIVFSGGRKRKVVHFNRLKPCFDPQKQI